MRDPMSIESMSIASIRIESSDRRAADVDARFVEFKAHDSSTEEDLNYTGLCREFTTLARFDDGSGSDGNVVSLVLS